MIHSYTTPPDRSNKIYNEATIRETAPEKKYLIRETAPEAD